MLEIFGEEVLFGRRVCQKVIISNILKNAWFSKLVRT